MLEILHYPNPLLTKIAKPIETIDEEIRKLADDMVVTMYKHEGIGLAAPQVGESIRLIVVDVSDPEEESEPLKLINPKLTPIQNSEGETHCLWEEGCLSVPELRSKVKRAAAVHVEALDIEGNKVEFDAEGLFAVCLQHEVDHLDGKLFIDRISHLKRSLYDKKLRKSGL